MNYRALHDYLYDISQNLDLTVKFFHGRKEWLNYTDQNKPLYIYSLPFTAANTVNTIEQYEQTWNISLIFYQRDYEDSALNQNDDDATNEDSIQEEIRTLTVTDQAADKFVRLFNENTISDDLESASDKITLVSFTKQPVIKDTASMLTGTVLTILAQFADTFDYCSFLENNPPLSLTATGGDPIVLNWVNQPNNPDIEIWRSIASGSDFELIDTIDSHNDSYNDTTTFGGVTYYYKIRYINQDDFSNEVNAVSTGDVLVDMSDISAAANWYDANSTDWKTKLPQDYTTTVSGDVSVFEDRLNAKDISQALVANRPLRLTNGIDFDGVDEWLDRSIVFFAYPISIFVIVKTTATDIQGIANLADSSSTDVQYGIDMSATGVGRGYARNGGDFARAVATTSSNDGEYQMIMIELIGDNSREVWINAVNEGSNTAVRTFNAAVDTFTVGRYGDSSPSAYFTGEISEVIIERTQYSTSDRQEVEGFLAWKYDIDLPVGHPYKDSPPTI